VPVFLCGLLFAFFIALSYNLISMNRVKFIYDLEPEKKTFPRLRKIVESSAFELTVVTLILTSVVLILVESFASLSTPVLAAVMEANDILTIIFIVELSCRWLISVNTKSFLKTYWLYRFRWL